MVTPESSRASGARRPSGRDALSVVLGVAVSLAAAPGADAREISRGSAGSSSSTQSGGASGSSASAVAQGSASAQEALSRTSQALASVKAMESAARSLAAGVNNLGLDPNHSGKKLPNVPNGLAVGGLQVATGVPKNLSHPVAGEDATLWQGANLPTQSTANGQTKVTVKQTSQQALLTWQTFNIGLNTTLSFDQSAGGASTSEWIVFNKINDPSGVPSQILGSIQASGQVYVLNQNGIIFGGASQVNVHTLVASSLPINENLLSRGLLNNPDMQFLFSQFQVAKITGGTLDAFTPKVTDPVFTVNSAAAVHKTIHSVANGSTPVVSYVSSATGSSTLTAGTDYKVGKDTDGKTVVTFTAAGIQKVGGAAISVSYVATNMRDGDITVQKGAVLSSLTTADHVGGRIALVGPNVSNAGTISTPDGQTILAAGLQVGLVAHATSDASLRGLDVYVGAVSDSSLAKPGYAGAATNTGLIDAPRADVTIAGKTVNQLGVIDSTTSVSLNGRVDLLANYGAVSAIDSRGATNAFMLSPTLVGTVTLGAGSVTRILPEWADTSTVVGSQLALQSRVNVQGEAIHMESDSEIFAPNAQVTLSAGNWVLYNKIYSFVATSGQIYMDQGAVIDAAGSTDVSASVTENVVSVQLRGSELANSPVQRDGSLRGKTVQIDVRQSGIYNGQAWVGTPLADTSGYIGLIQRSVGELTTSGGNVKITAGGSVVMQAGSKVDVSGGWIDYQGGTIQTTKVISGGHILDISKATPDLVYDGVYTGFTAQHNSKWGVTQTYTDSLRGAGHYEAGYVQGGNGGAISISAPTMALDGSLLGQTVTGSHQRTNGPQLGSLSLSFSGLQLPDAVFPTATSPNVLIEQGISQTAAEFFSLDASGNPVALRSDRANLVVLSPDLASEFGSLSINTSASGNITLAPNTSLTLPAGGSLSLAAANIDLEGKVSAPAGSVSLSVTDISPLQAAKLNAVSGAATPSADATRGQFTLGSSASLSTAGLTVNDRFGSPTDSALPLATNAGTIAIDGGSVKLYSYSANLEAGSVIDVSGGVYYSSGGKFAYGQGGSIDLKAGQDTGITSVLGGKLTLGSTLKGYGHTGTDKDSKSVLQSILGAGAANYAGSQGGSLSILAPAIQIGGSRTDNGVLYLSSAFFSEGGFGSFTLNGLGEVETDAAGKPTGNYLAGLVIAPETTIAPVVESQQATPSYEGGFSLTTTVLPQAFRTPVTLNLSAGGVIDYFNSLLVVRGDAVMGEGASIRTDPGGVVSLKGNTVAVLGSIVAPGGSITVSGANSYPSNVPLSNPLSTVDIGPKSLLSTAGTEVLTPNTLGYNTGTLLSGGNIKVSGNIVAEAGSVLNVSGASDTLDFASGYENLTTLTQGTLSRVLYTPKLVESNAGSVTLAGGQELFTDATLLGASGGSTAMGGSLTLSCGRFFAPGLTSILTPLEVTMQVSQSEATIPKSFYGAGQTAIGHAVVDSKGQPVAGMGYFAADSFDKSGFDSLTIQGTVQFTGPVEITANRSVTLGLGVTTNGGGYSGGVIYGNSAVTIDAPYVSLGASFQTPLQATQLQNAFLVGGQAFDFQPKFGTGSFSVNAKLIDVGNLSFQNIGKLDLTANNGDVRGDGTVDVAGAITISAGQVYPATEVNFTIAAHDYSVNGANHAGSVTFAASGDRELPLSAGGILNVYATTIDQGGTLRAPLGTINLGWDGVGTGPLDLISGKTVNGTEHLTLLTGGVTSVSAVDPLTGEALTIPYGINVNGTAWIDPSGTDITKTSLSQKAVNLSAASVTQEAGSTIDIRGGGDLYSYRWVSGVGGTKDVLASTTSFAIIPGYQADYAPYATYNTGQSNSQFGTDSGYTNSNLKVGDRVYLGASQGLAAGFYTLLPARYALLSGAYLVTPESGTPVGTVTQSDGSSLVSGYRINDSTASGNGQPLLSRFEVASSTVVRNRAQYDDYYANDYLGSYAKTHGLTVPRLPLDSGQLVFAATRSMSIAGTVSSEAVSGGRGGMVDISSPVDILIAGSTTTGQAGALVLNASELSAFGAESLLIGGIRHETADGTEVTVTTNKLTVNNAGSSFTGSDLILVAKTSLTLASGAEIGDNGASTTSAETLHIGDSTVAGSGNGALLRVSSDLLAQDVRAGVDASTKPLLAIGAGAKITGASITLDSTYGTKLDPSATLSGKDIALDSGQISLQLTDPGSLNATSGLVLSSAALQTLQTGAQSLSLLSYSSIDIYGTGQLGNLNSSGNQTVTESLSLHAAEIRGFNNGGGTVTFAAKNITLDNAAGGTSPGTAGGLAGTVAFEAEVIRLGANRLNVDQYAHLALNASSGVLLTGVGSLGTDGAVAITTPVIAGAQAADQTIVATGALSIAKPSGNAGTATVGGAGAKLNLSAASITDNSDILLPGGSVTLHATGAGGNVTVGNLASARIDVGGVAQNFFDLTKYSSAGQVSLISDQGDVILAAGGVLSLSAQSGGGNAGTLSVSAQEGYFTATGTLLGKAGAQGQAGTFLLDAGSIAGGSLMTIDAALDGGGFTQSRTIRVRTGDVLVDGLATSHEFDLSADRGTITVAGEIDASGATGGTISLDAGGSVVLSAGSLLTAAGNDFNDAGKGGSVSLETRGIGGGVIDLQTGSKIDLSVQSFSATSAAEGHFTGTLHLRAPQTAGNANLLVNPIDGTVLNASSIAVEGFTTFDLTATGGAITNTGNITQTAGGAIASTNVNVENSVLKNGQAFMLHADDISAGLLQNNQGLKSVLQVEPGAEIINRAGDLTLSSDWDLANSSLGAFRFGANNVPGVLTLRASGNLVFNGALSDGFGPAPFDAWIATDALWEAPLLAAGSQSWSFRLVAGADFTAADFHKVLPLSTVNADDGSLLLGKGGIVNIAGSQTRKTGPNALTSDAVNGYYQVIRTGSGDIDISVRGSVKLLNQFATIYTAGIRVANPTQLSTGAFDLPVLNCLKGSLGAIQETPFYSASYSYGGGNVSIVAQGDIEHLAQDNAGNPIADSERELPTNWLYRRGYVDASGQFGVAANGDVASTTWWIDFSNFFEGIGALGGGNVTLIAGHDISNVDAVVPTNARMPKGTPSASKLVELGGGDLLVKAGHDINGGVYYVERGQGTLVAGHDILTNSTRSASLDTINGSAALPEQTWLPTTLFLGKGSFDVTAVGDLLLGPVANPFLLPESVNNTYWYKTYFSTYASTDTVNVTSLTGAVTLRESATLPLDSGPTSLLQIWYADVLALSNNASTPFVSSYQPWLRLDETSVVPFTTAFTLMPSALRVTAFAGDIDLVGNLTLSPSPTGTIDLAAAGTIAGLQPSGVTSFTGSPNNAWTSSVINLSDASPDSIWGAASPYAYQTLAGTVTGQANKTGQDFLLSFDSLFAESGSVEGSHGVLQTQQALHAPGVLHAADANPVHLYAESGDISGLTLFAGKAARIDAGEDITDIAFYLQNTRTSDVSVVAAGRDIIAYDSNSALRTEATQQASGSSIGNLLTDQTPLAGDLQIAGPGTLEVLAGRNLDLGVGPNNADGTAVGITSIGNGRNPYLSFAGADIIAAAGIGSASDLSSSRLNFNAFLQEIIGSADGARYFSELSAITGEATGVTAATVNQLPEEQRDAVALDLFYLALRDAGRNHSLSTSAGYGNYKEGTAAIAALFGGSSWLGDISLTSREIKTKSGGNISLLAPGGGLTVGFDISGNQAVDQGILTEDGGNISIFTNNDVTVGTSRIFTLRGGNEIIWSTLGNIAAGASSKTVQSAPPTRVLIDPQSGDVKTDLAGLATGGGIGVLATVTGVAPGDVDLIAPSGTIDAGDAGIRVSGNINVSALVVLNASNIQVSGASVGTPVVVTPSVNTSGISAAAATTAATNSASDQVAKQNHSAAPQEETPSLITVEVIGYGGGDE